MKKQILTIGLASICILSSFGYAESIELPLDSNVSKIEFSTPVKDFDMPIVKESVSKTKKKNKTVKKTEASPKEEDVILEDSNEVIEEPIVEDSVIEEPVVEESIIEEPVAEEQYYDDSYTVDENEYSDSSSSLTRESGVNYYNDRKETYYSSNVLYHYRTDEWTVDEEGFYRTDEGYYVVAASDMPQGTTFEGSKGTCIVLDSGCDEGTTDYYVNF